MKAKSKCGQTFIVGTGTPITFEKLESMQCPPSWFVINILMTFKLFCIGARLSKKIYIDSSLITKCFEKRGQASTIFFVS